MAEKWLSKVAKSGDYNDLLNKPQTTSEVNVDSDTIIATAKAVHTAYQKALEACEASK